MLDFALHLGTGGLHITCGTSDCVNAVPFKTLLLSCDLGGERVPAAFEISNRQDPKPFLRCTEVAKFGGQVGVLAPNNRHLGHQLTGSLASSEE